MSHRWLLLGMPCLCLTASLAACGGGLQLTLSNSSVQKPSNVALYFSVEKADGAPVAGLQADSFRIYEDGKLISPFESKQTILNPEVAVVHYTLLLLDLSGSIVESGSLHTLVQAASSFSERVTKQQQVAIYGFDGSAKLYPFVNFTSHGGAVSSGLARISTHRTRDPSTNLNGAVLAAVKVLEQQMSRATQPLRFGTLVVFTDGTDRAHRVPVEEVHRVLDEASVNTFVIGLGAELDQRQLSALGRSGFVKAEDQAHVSTAFDEVAARIEAAARRFYLLSYCSPARAGTHQLTVEAVAEGQTGSLTHEFNADGFGPNCDPTRKPSFPVGRITVRPRR